jgi:hypothetical protein
MVFEAERNTVGTWLAHPQSGRLDDDAKLAFSKELHQ